MTTQPQRRFAYHHASTGNVFSLRPDHPALSEARTLFPSTVVSPTNSPRLLVSGKNSRKIGDRVVKGPWSGFPIYTLTLEERATCPRTCFHWSSCYGNNMHYARRHQHGQDLETRLMAELAEKQRRHPKGFVVRLHVLGDFYSVEYVNLWHGALLLYPALHVFGYTARLRSSAIGKALDDLTFTHWHRFAIRFSGTIPRPQSAVTIFTVPPEQPKDAIICPAQLDKTSCCGTCGLCWSETTRNKTILFVAHGKKLPTRKAPKRKSEEIHLTPA